VFASAIGEEDERDSIGLQEVERLGGAWDGNGASDENAIDAADQSEVRQIYTAAQPYSKANAKSGTGALLLLNLLC
jgi:hypothetical protein